MGSTEMNDIVERVVQQYLNRDLTRPPIPVRATSPCVYLTAETAEALFGPKRKLTKKEGLPGPGEFICTQQVSLQTPLGCLENVEVIGPEREATRVVLPLSAAWRLGIDVPVNPPGDMSGAADLQLLGDRGSFTAPGCAVAARAHIHMTPAHSRAFGVYDRQIVQVRVKTSRPLVFDHVVICVGEDVELAMYIDVDEAAACCATEGAWAEILPVTFQQ